MRTRPLVNCKQLACPFTELTYVRRRSSTNLWWFAALVVCSKCNYSMRATCLKFHSYLIFLPTISFKFAARAKSLRRESSEQEMAQMGCIMPSSVHFSRSTCCGPVWELWSEAAMLEWHLQYSRLKFLSLSHSGNLSVLSSAFRLPPSPLFSVESICSELASPFLLHSTQIMMRLRISVATFPYCSLSSNPHVEWSLRPRAVFPHANDIKRTRPPHDPPPSNSS